MLRRSGMNLDMSFSAQLSAPIVNTCSILVFGISRLPNGLLLSFLPAFSLKNKAVHVLFWLVFNNQFL